jgi:N-acetylglucosaminyldiphosphoundecaprenol N-acetyl-beta-D-mannosaminyltransferase
MINMANTLLHGLNIYTEGKEQLLKDIKQRKGKIHIISGNAEVLKYPLSDRRKYRLFLAEENIIIPDGISVYLPIKRRVETAKKIAGIEFMQMLLEDFQNSGKPVYFLGAKQQVIVDMIEKFKVIYPRLTIAGYHNGYFDKNDCGDIIENIKASKPFALFVALGTPAQEDFIFQYAKDLPCTIYMGVGGSFDVLSGNIKRSPKWLCDIGLEWLYRLISDPSKLNRMQTNISFTIKALLKNDK